MNLPILYKQTSTGKIQEWFIFVQEDGLNIDASGNKPAEIVTVYGLQDGKKQTAKETIAKGKNIGRANETTPLEQAMAEAQSQWEKKIKRGYVQSLEAAESGQIDGTRIAGGVEPMLAHQYDKQGSKISFPAFVQPKLDGHRCIAIIQDGQASLWSRTRKRITGVPHIERELEQMYPGESIILDGELYNHDYRERFEELTSFIRQSTPKPGAEVVQYWVYDVVTDGDFAHRAASLDDVTLRALNAGCKKVSAVATFDAESEDDLMEKFQIFLDNGFEGAMVRNAKGNYKNKRSYDLQKVKQFQDAEYPVIRIEEGRGKMAGRALFVCETPEGKEFRVKMIGALDDLKTYFENQAPWIGRQLTVKFQNLSADGIPRFPVAIRFRNEI